MELKLSHGCYSDYITIDNRDAEKEPIDSIRNALIKAIQIEDNKEDLIDYLRQLINCKGQWENGMQCDQCGEWTYDSVLNIE